MRYVHGPSGHATDQAEARERDRKQGKIPVELAEQCCHGFLTEPCADCRGGCACQQEPSPRGFVFELAVATSAPVWPHAADGVKPVMEAVQSLLEKACGGNIEGFQTARIELEEAALQWEKDLFESEREP